LLAQLSTPILPTDVVGAFDLAIAPGHAALMWTQGGATVSSEPVT
jgi:hypothetical protein